MSFGEINPKIGGGRKAVSETQNVAGPPARAATQNDVAIGAGAVASAPNSVAVGVLAKTGSTGNIAIGANAGTSVAGNSAGANSIAIGTNALAGNQTGVGIAIGANSSTHGGGSGAGIAIGDSATVALTGGIAIGSPASAATNGSIAIGVNATTEFPGQISFSTGGGFNSTGLTAMFGVVPLWARTTDATPTLLGASGGSATNNPGQTLTLANASTYLFDIDIVARKSAAGTDYSAWNLKFCINREADAASTALVGTLIKTLIGQTAGASTWDVTCTADTTTGYPNIRVTGQASTTIKWAGQARVTKVGG